MSQYDFVKRGLYWIVLALIWIFIFWFISGWKDCITNLRFCSNSKRFFVFISIWALLPQYHLHPMCFFYCFFFVDISPYLRILHYCFHDVQSNVFWIKLVLEIIIEVCFSIWADSIVVIFLPFLFLVMKSYASFFYSFFLYDLKFIFNHFIHHKTYKILQKLKCLICHNKNIT